jgi:hypothetical protein
MYAKMLMHHNFFMPAERRPARKRRLKMVGNSGKSSAPASDYWRISDREPRSRSFPP